MKTNLNAKVTFISQHYSNSVELFLMQLNKDVNSGVISRQVRRTLPMEFGKDFY